MEIFILYDNINHIKMKKIFYTVLAFIFCFSLNFNAFGQKTEKNQFEEFEKGSFVASNGDILNYRLLPPLDFDSKKQQKYPIIIFLHGAGERGDDNYSQLLHGGQKWLNPVVREKYPAFVLCPQCPKDARWSKVKYHENDKGTKKEMLHSLKELIESFIAKDEIDDKKVYITGLSMGGVGTFDMCCNYPELFDAAIPMCGNANIDLLKNAKDVRFRIYHGDKDVVVPFEGSRRAYKELKRVGADVTYIEYVGVGHNCWNDAFNDEEYLSWLFGKRN